MQLVNPKISTASNLNLIKNAQRSQAGGRHNAIISALTPAELVDWAKSGNTHEL